MEEGLKESRSAPRQSPRRLVLTRLLRNKAAMTSLALIVFLLVVAAAAPVVSPYSYEEMDREHKLEAPTWKHLMGTDFLGRDLVSRMI